MMMSINDNDFVKLTSFIQDNYGINLATKKILIEGRLGNMVIEKGFKNFSDYLTHVFSNDSKEEITNLINKLTTNHTFFMRENSHFEYFKDKVLPFLVSSLKQKDLRIWSAGCSSGEEPYTLAMILADYLGEENPKWDSKILATDISVKVLEIAEKAIYGSESIDKLPNSWKMSYLKKVDKENYQFEDRIKNEVIFRIFNLMDEEFPFKKKFHAIFCRNVMIYFDAKTKIQLINKFYELTEPGGYLFIGHSESINRGETHYRYIMPAVYRKG
jgi:chemotaxis protein methyltransferase CheR